MKLKELVKIAAIKTFCLPLKMNRSRSAIIYYHSINPKPNQLSTSPEILEKHLLYLKKNNFNFLTLDNFEKLEKVPFKKSVLITFDDGLKDNYEIARPILEKYEVPAVFFVSVGLIGREFKYGLKCMDWNEVKKIDAHPLFEIGSHGLTHSKLHGLPEKRIWEEIKNSKEILEKKLNTDIRAFAFPYGRYRRENLEFLKKAGYSFGFAANQKNLFQDISRWELPRVCVNKFSVNCFECLFKNGYQSYWSTYSKAVRLIRKLSIRKL